MSDIIEKKRLSEVRDKNIPWKKWGPYLSERQWGTVREDYSKNADAWNYFTHDQARSRAYRWGEDGIGGISDEKQHLCFALALWNGKDPILKERLFGLNNSEGNHGEDVKEYYFYLDSTPTHSYMKYLYKYTQEAYPYSDLVKTNKKRNRNELEYELLDTGVFDKNNYFDIFVEYAKKSPEDILIKISIHNRGDSEALLHVLPTLWFRNTWAWKEHASKPTLKKLEGTKNFHLISAVCSNAEKKFLHCEGSPPLLFTENETNNEKIFKTKNESTYVKDGINNYLVEGQKHTINPENIGTKTSADYQLIIGPSQDAVVRLRLSDKIEDVPFGDEFDLVFSTRILEADQFYESITPSSLNADSKNVFRQAMAGLLWSKQYYFFDANLWLKEHNANPFDLKSLKSRNKEWFHMINDHVISMPDKWEYPWYAAWDLDFHAIALSVVDPDFAKEQLNLMLQEVYMHPNGQIPAYEWNFSDVNPPVHAWATLFLSRLEEMTQQKADIDFLKRSFTKLLLNFTWWVNRKDRFGKNIFEGGFLGLDNIGVFDRSSPLPTGGYLEQADSTAWMSFFCQNMLELSINLASHDPIYEDLAIKFGEHFFWIATAINKIGQDGMWDEEDGFYYDLLRKPDGSTSRLKVRSIVGILPLCAVTVIEPEQREKVPRVVQHFLDRIKQMPEILQSVHLTGPGHLGIAGRGIFSLVNQENLKRILSKVLDENEFLSPFGIRALSKYHQKNPYIFYVGETEYKVKYEPAESDSGMFGGNSNWRGPIWLPMNVLIIRALLQYYLYYGNNFLMECPTGSGKMMNLFDISKEIASRLTSIFLRDEQGTRPVYGETKKFQDDPYWNDYILFYEYFHGDNGAGLGASHQTGWTGIIGKIIQLYGILDPEKLLQNGKMEAFRQTDK